MRKLKQNIYNIIDLEATCWEDREYQKANSEIIEIGIVQLNLTTKTIVDSESYLITPTRGEISEFCTNLTSISPQMIKEAGRPFTEVCELLTQRFKTDRHPWGSWGFYDRNQLEKDAQLNKCKNPFSFEHENIKHLFARLNGRSKGEGIKKALQVLNMEFDGTHHRGIDDAINIAKIYLTLLK